MFGAEGTRLKKKARLLLPSVSSSCLSDPPIRIAAYYLRTLFKSGGPILSYFECTEGVLISHPDPCEYDIIGLNACGPIKTPAMTYPYHYCVYGQVLCVVHTNCLYSSPIQRITMYTRSIAEWDQYSPNFMRSPGDSFTQ